MLDRPAGGATSPAAPSLSTEFPFTLPRGYVDGRGQLHRDGVMRLATAGDEIWPQTDPRVRENPAYLSVLLLTRTVTNLGSLPEVDSRVDREPVRVRSRLPAGPLPPHQPRRRHTSQRDMPQVRARVRCRHQR